MKLNKNWKIFIIRTLSMMTLMALSFMAISLYTPIKGLVYGKSFTLIEFLSYIELKKYLVIIIAIPIALSAIELRKKTEKISTDCKDI